VYEEVIVRTVLKLKVKGKCPRGRPRFEIEEQVRKDVT
jgi:hypothetical protein